MLIICLPGWLSHLTNINEKTKMADNFFALSKETQHALLNGKLITIKCKSTNHRKDIWICWILQKLFALPIAMAFKDRRIFMVGYK